MRRRDSHVEDAAARNIATSQVDDQSKVKAHTRADQMRGCRDQISVVPLSVTSTCTSKQFEGAFRANATFPHQEKGQTLRVLP